MAGSAKGARARRTLAAAVMAAAAVAIAASPASAMRSHKISSHLCKTVNGGKFVGIPGFPGEEIDRRLIPDIRWLKRRFDIFITDGYSRDRAHAENGEHPIGLATDIVPNTAKNGSWNEIGDLAHLAEPHQNEPVMPWRWVGWNGDAGHGRGNHLHLSWSHSPTSPGDPARVVYTRTCPRWKKHRQPGGGDSGHHNHDGHGGHNGGTGAGSGGGDGGGGGGGSNGGTGVGSGGGGGSRSGGSRSGGISPRIGKLAPAVPERY